jgi:hypothetical protein
MIGMSKGPSLMIISGLAISLAFTLCGCSRRIGDFEKIKDVEFLFDGGSVVFYLKGIDLNHEYLKLSAVKDLDPVTGEILPPQRVKVSLLRRESRRFVDERMLETGSDDERLVLKYLGDCQKTFRERNDFWAIKLEKLIALISHRETIPPEVYYWQ